MSSDRPYLQLSTAELEALYRNHCDDSTVLFDVLNELVRRSSASARSLKEHVHARLKVLAGNEGWEFGYDGEEVPFEDDVEPEVDHGRDDCCPPNREAAEGPGSRSPSGPSSSSESDRETLWLFEPAESEPLAPAASDDEYEVHLAACEWDMDPAILINGPNDIQARVHWKDVLEPFEHQIRNLITFCRRAPVALLADDVGLGKTISAGLVMSELMTRRKVDRVLVVVPKAVLLDQWRGELEERFRIPSQTGRGAALDGLLRDKRIEVVITTYDSARNRLDEIGPGLFDMIVLDEAHKLRNLHGTSSPPQTAVRFKQALQARKFRYVLMLTATPIQNRLWDLYSLVDLLTVAKGHLNPLGSPNAFARKFIGDGKSQARVLRSEKKSEFRRILSEYMVRTRRADANLVFPPRKLQVMLCVGSEGEFELIQLVSALIEDLNPLVQTSLAQALMSSPRALVAQLRNMAGTRSIDQGTVEEAAVILRQIDLTAKEERLLKVVADLRDNREDWRLVVFTSRKETQEALGELLRARIGEEAVGYIRGGNHLANLRAIEGYNESPPVTHVLISTDAGTEGLNLQAGNVLVNYDLPWNPMVLEQRIGRVQRLGSKHAQVSVLNLVLQGSVEEHVVSRLVEKLAVIADSLGEIEGILDEMGGKTGDDVPLEKQIRDLVVGSLRGIDVQASLESIQRSIQRAKQIYDQEREAVEKNLGKLDSMHEAGPVMPVLSSFKPRLGYRDFTLRALQLGEGSLEEFRDGRRVHRRRGYPPEEVVFTREEESRPRPRGVAGGAKVGLYMPGRPAFEKLGEVWRRRAQHAVRDGRDVQGIGRRQAAKEWLSGFAAELRLLGVDLVEETTTFDGAVVVRSAISVAHDKYEKLIELPVRTPGAEPIHVSDEVPLYHEPLAISGKVVPAKELEGVIRGGMHADPDVERFASFYKDRLDEELQKAAGDEKLQSRHREELIPRVTTRVVGASGAVQSIETVTVRFELDGQSFEEQLKIGMGGRALLSAPEPQVCQASGDLLPPSCIGECVISGCRVKVSSLHRSDRSGRLASEEFMVQCEVSGVQLVQDEVERSTISGRLVDRELLIESAVSGRFGYGDEVVDCEFTGAQVLKDEVATSEVSGKQFRSDQAVRGGRAKALGHRSEFVECEVSGERLLPTEVAESAVSGRVVDREIAVRSAKSGALGAPEETVTCAVTGATLLTTEAELCAVTQEQVDRDLLVPSDISGALGRRELLVTCEVSGVRGLPTEFAPSAVSGKFVARRLLRPSGLSGKLALEDELEACAESGELLLPSELEASSVSGKRVKPERLRECAVSGVKALEVEMVEDALDPGHWIIAGEAAVSDLSQRASRSDRASRCPWSGAVLLEDEFIRCHWTGLRLDPRVLHRRSYLEALDARVQSPSGTGRIEKVDSLVFGPEFKVEGIGRIKSLQSVRRITSPSGDLLAVSGIRKRMLGLAREKVAFLLKESGQVIGRGRVD